MLTRPLAVATFTLLAMACGGSSSGPITGSQDGGTKTDSGNTGDSGVSITKACTDRSTAQCALISSCDPYTLESRYGGMAACVTALATSCENSLAAPSTGNDAEATEACAMAYSTWSCADFENNVNPPAACVPKTGSLASGAPCGFAAQCQSGFCGIPPGSSCGACADQPTAGASCADLTTCGTGLVCSDKSETCVTYGTMGAACGGDAAPCGYELVCVGAKKGMMGTCTPAVTKVGAACDPSLAKGPDCALSQGLTCNKMSKQCERVTYAASGGACGVVDDQNVYCSAAGVCNATAGAAGTCVAPAAPDGTCGGSSGAGCAPPARCIGAVTDAGITGTCQIQTTTCK